MKRPFKVYYRKEPTFIFDNQLTKIQVINEITHVYLLTIQTVDIESVFQYMQAEIWSPVGEAVSLINSKGLHHTSMSVGDVIIDVLGNVMWQANTLGWKEILK